MHGLRFLSYVPNPDGMFGCKRWNVQLDVSYNMWTGEVFVATLRTLWMF